MDGYPHIEDSNESAANHANLQITTLAEQLREAVPSPTIEQLLADADNQGGDVQ